MVVVRYLLWNGDEHDCYLDDILDLKDHMSLSEMLKAGIDICEYHYPEGFHTDDHAYLIRYSNYRLMKAMFTNERFFCIGVLEVQE